MFEEIEIDFQWIRFGSFIKIDEVSDKVLFEESPANSKVIIDYRH